jgi:hypothetical protein
LTRLPVFDAITNADLLMAGLGFPAANGGKDAT